MALPEAPQTRLEQYLEEIAKDLEGGGGGGGGGLLVAQTTVALEDLYDPSQGEIAIELDKTFGELSENVANTAVAVNITIEGAVAGTMYCYPDMAQIFEGEGALIYDCGEYLSYVDMPIKFVVTVFSESGETAAMIIKEQTATDKFVITCTPTAADFSGTMDKAPFEILTAYNDGKQIVVRVPTSLTSYSDVSPSSIDVSTTDGEPVSASVVAIAVITDNGASYLCQFYTSISDQTYSVRMFPLASGTWNGGNY